MTKFQLAMMALNAVVAATDALVRAKAVYDTFKQEAERTNELTPEESAALDAEAQRVFSSSASQPSGR